MLPVAGPAEVRRYARGLIRRYPRELTVVVVLHGLAAVSGLVAPRLLGGLVEDIENGTGAVTVDRVALAIIAFVVLQAVLVRFARLASAKLGEQALARLREEFVERVLAIPLPVVERAGTGDLLTRTSRDVDALSYSVRSALPETGIALVTGAFVLGALVLVGPLLAVPCLIVVPSMVLVTRWYLRRASAGYLREGAAYADVTDGLAETVDGARTVDALRRQSQREARTHADLRRSAAAERYTLFLRTVFWPATEIGYVVPIVATLVIGGWFHIQGWVSLGAVTAATLYVQQLIDPLDRLLSTLDELQVGQASLARLLGVAQLPGTAPAIAAPTGRSGLVASGVHFSYVPGREVLTGIDLHLRPGERLAIVGPSGAGKSTLGRLLAGVHAPTSGTVTLGGTPLTDLPLERLRTEVALVTQEHHVFLGTVRDNVSLVRPDASDDEVRSALAAVGLDAALDADAGTLSAAAAQQLALARLVLADPHTLVLDEATSLIDPRAARDLERSLAAVLHGRTVVAIAHRLFSAHDADRVAVVEDGRITELGPHAELVAAGGSYAALWRSWHGDPAPAPAA
jgi:ABC-type multidrug transport system fused ATPase/permease subunit